MYAVKSIYCAILHAEDAKECEDSSASSVSSRATENLVALKNWFVIPANIQNLPPIFQKYAPIFKSLLTITVVSWMVRPTTARISQSRDDGVHTYLPTYHVVRAPSPMVVCVYIYNNYIIIYNYWAWSPTSTHVMLETRSRRGWCFNK